MNQEKIKAIMSQIDELTMDELKEVYRQIRKKKREWNDQGREETIQAEKEKDKLIQSGNLREIMLFVHGHQYFHDDGKPSSYDYVIIDKETGKARKKSSDKIGGETSNRAIILGIIDALNNLSKDKKCRINIYTKITWGFAKMKRNNKGVNGDLLEQLHEVIQNRGDIVETFEDPNLIEKYLYNIE